MINAPLPIDPQTANHIPAIIQQASAPEAASMLQREDLSDFVKKLVLGYLVNKSIKANDAHHISTGVEIFDVQKGKPIFSRNVDTQHFAASINKLPVVLLVLEDLRSGHLSMDQRMTWEASDVRAGAGVYDQPGAPLEASLDEVIFDLFNRSGNTAVRVLVNYGLGGAQAVNDRWAQMPELSNTRLQPLDANRFFLGNSTPRDSLWTTTQLLKTEDQYSVFIKNALKTNIYTDVGVRSQLAGNDYIVLANKVGLLDDVEGNNRHDVGVIYNTKTHRSYAYSFFTTSPYDSDMATPQAEQSLKDMGRYTLRFSGDAPVTQMHRQQPLPRQTQLPEARILY